MKCAFFNDKRIEGTKVPKEYVLVVATWVDLRFNSQVKMLLKRETN